MLATEDKGGISLSPSNSCIFFFIFSCLGDKMYAGGLSLAARNSFKNCWKRRWERKCSSSLFLGKLGVGVELFPPLH